MSRKLVPFLALACVWAGGFAQAIDMRPHLSDTSEAVAFFTQLSQTSPNPVIARMATESLRRIRDVETRPSKKPVSTTEIALLPQIDNTYVVPAMLNRSVMATFLVDTGASYTVITPQTARALGIEIGPDAPMIPITTANGTVQAPVVTLKNVSLGGIQVNNVQAVVTDLGDAPQLSGLLGMSFFQGMELSFKQDRLIISR